MPGDRPVRGAARRRPARATRAVVAVDVGGTSMKGAVVGRDGSVLAAPWRATRRERGPAAVVEGIFRFATELVEQTRELTGQEPAAAGLAVPGLVDEATGTAIYSANIGWRDEPLAELAADELGTPVALGHDVRAGGLAEALLGAGRGVDDFLFVPIGTGIAGAVVLRGAPYSGSRGWSGELGHVPVWPEGESCACGQRGCLEVYASAAAITRRYGGGPGMRTEDVLGRAVSGDPDAARVWREAVEALAIALAGYTLTLDPELLVIGGGLAECRERLLVPLRERLRARLALREPPPLAMAELGSRAAVMGAALLAWRAAGEPEAGDDW